MTLDEQQARIQALIIPRLDRLLRFAANGSGRELEDLGSAFTTLLLDRREKEMLIAVQPSPASAAAKTDQKPASPVRAVREAGAGYWRRLWRG